MTNDQFAVWRARHFRSVLACAKALGLDRDTVVALESGRTRRGNAYPVPHHIELACAAWTMSLRSYDGGAVVFGDTAQARR